MTPTAQDRDGLPGHHIRHGHGSDVDGQAEILELDAEVLAEHTASITAWLPLAARPRQIVDLGCGTGAGTFALLARFPEAHVTAVDSSADLLRRLRASLHHMADPDRILRRVRDTLGPGAGCSPSSNSPASPGSCPMTPRRSAPVWRSAATPRASVATPSTCRTGGPTGAPS